MKDYVAEMNDNEIRVPAKLKKALNGYLAKYDLTNDPAMGRFGTSAHKGALIRDGRSLGYSAPVVLIIEDSDLYHILNPCLGDWPDWKAHTEFFDAFNGCGYYPEAINSCVIGFYKD